MLRIFARMNEPHVYSRNGFMSDSTCLFWSAAVGRLNYLRNKGKRNIGRAGIKQINARYDRDRGAGISCMRVSIFAYGRGVEFVVVSKAVFGYDDEKG